MIPNHAAQGKSENDGAHSHDRDSSAGHEIIASFDAFYDFAFPRVHRFAQRHTKTESEAEALCSLVLIRALASLGGLGALATRVHREPAVSRLTEDAELDGSDAEGSDPSGSEPAGLAFWLYCIARKTAQQVEHNPELLKSDRVGSELAKVEKLERPINWSRVRVPSRSQR